MIVCDHVCSLCDHARWVGVEWDGSPVRPRCPRSPDTVRPPEFPRCQFPRNLKWLKWKIFWFHYVLNNLKSPIVPSPAHSTPTSPAAEPCHHHPPDTIVPPPPAPTSPLHSNLPAPRRHTRTHIAPAARQPPHTKPPKPPQRQTDDASRSRCGLKPSRRAATPRIAPQTPRASDWGFSREPHSQLVVLPVRSSSPLLLRLRRGWCSR